MNAKAQCVHDDKSTGLENTRFKRIVSSHLSRRSRKCLSIFRHAATALVWIPRSMALTRRELAIAGLSIFIAWGFATRWVPVLRYLGYAFITGALSSTVLILILVLFSSKSRNHASTKATRTSPIPAFLTPEAWEADSAWLCASGLHSRQPLYPSSFVVSDGLNGLLDIVLRDFVTSWHRSITPHPNFANEIDKAIRSALINVRKRLENVDIVDIAVAQVVPIITNHLKDFYEAEHMVRGKKLNRNVTESEELDLAIAAKYKDGRLHPAASLAFSDTKLLRQEYLRKLVVRLMPEILPESTIRSRAVSVLIKEIVSCAVLAPTLQMLSDPDMWNQLMEAYVSFT